MSLPLGNIARNVVATAFDLAGEIVQAMTYTQHKAVTYDPATGEVPIVTADPGSTVTGNTVNAIVGGYSQRETDGQTIRVGDEKLIVKASELSGVTPIVDDYLLAGSVKRLILDVKLDPTGTVYIFQTRKAQV